MDTLYDLFEASVGKYEANIALVWKDNDVCHVTYGLLQEYANKISEFLSELIEEGCFVGILMDREPLLCCVVLGILKKRLGFAFIDSKSSYQRNVNFVQKLDICWIISASDVSQAPLLKSHAKWSKNITLRGSKIYLWKVKTEGIVNKPKVQNKFSYAYAVQTSGTTGKPKIVKVPHKCVVPNILDFGRILKVQTSDVILLGTSLTFDPSVVEIFLPLANGASLALPTAYEMATIVQTTPSLLTTLYNWKLMPKLRCLVLGGEPCPSPSVLVQRLNLLPSRVAVFSAYGITEVSCWASLQCVELDVDVETVPLGKPLSETLMEVRDGQGNVLTAGEGHMYIGSSHRICLVDDELEEDLPAIVFRPTGDIVKVCSDSLLYMGRNDRITKRWGHRVDLLLVETTATKLTSGAICCAVLVASSLVLAVSKCDNCSQLRKQLMDVLPLDHVPDVVVEIKKFPLTSHGKVDVPSVQSCVVSLVHSKQIFIKKTSEEILKTLWSELLNKEPSSEGFLAEGGSSILALQLFSLLELHLGHHPPASLLPALLTGRGATVKECVHILDNADYISDIKFEGRLGVNNLHQQSSSVSAAASRKIDKNSQILPSGSFITLTVPPHQEQSTNAVDSTIVYQTVENNSHNKKLITNLDSKRIYGENVQNLIEDHHDHYSPACEYSKTDTKMYHCVDQYSDTSHDEKMLQKREETEIMQENLEKTVDCTYSSSAAKISRTLKRKDIVSEGQCANSETVFPCNRTIKSVKRRAIAQHSKSRDLESEQLFKTREEREFIESHNRHLTEKLSSVCKKGEEHSILWCSDNCSLDLAKDYVLHSHCQGRTEKYSAVEPCMCHCKVHSGTSLSLMWKLYLNKCIDSSPCIASYERNRLVIVGSHSGQFATIHDDGKVHSILQLGGRIEAPACLSPCGHQAYVGCYDGNVYAIDITHGTVMWVFSAGDKVKGAPVLCCHQTAIVIGCYNQKLYCIKVQDGTCLWSCKLSRGSICASPCVDSHEGLIFAGTLDGTIAAIEEMSGEVVWQCHLSAPIFSSPVSFHHLDNCVVVVAEVLGKVHCYDASKGEKLWTFQAAGNVFSSLCFFETASVHEDNSGSYLFFGCHDHKVYCLGTDGQLLWTSKLDSPVYATPFPFSTVNKKAHFVAVASTSGALSILHAKSGELICSKNIGCEVFSSPAVCGGVLVIGARDDYLYSFELTEA